MKYKNNNGMSCKEKDIFGKRQVGLDIYRIFSAFFVFLFHSNMHIQCDYGYLNPFIGRGQIFMSAFFLLSGFSLYLNWNNRDLNDIKEVKRFYIKRLIGTLPLYYAVAVLYIFLLGKETPLQNILLIPIEILVVQSNFNGLFTVTHNGGTWFVSCILMCYLVYPLIQEITKQIKTRSKMGIICIAVFICLYSPLIVYFFQTNSTYANPFFRIMEFMSGVLICSLLKEHKETNRFLFSWRIVILESIVLLVAVTLIARYNIKFLKLLESWVTLPLFMLLIISISGAEFPSWMQNSKTIGYLSEISYAFFLGQFFTWKTTLFVINYFLGGIDTNVMRIVISFTSCITYTILLHEIIEKPIKKFLMKRFL